MRKAVRHKKDIAAALGGAFVLVLFVGSAALAQEFSHTMQYFLQGRGAAGMMFYVFASIAATVVAPLTTVPLIPLAAALWGPIPTALLSIAAWWIGAIIAFWISRRFGEPLVRRIVSLDGIAEWERALGARGEFFTVLLLRMAVPVDVLSYAIGLFTTMRLAPYAVATLLGIAPFAFIFSYAASFSIWYQVGALVLAGAVAATAYFRVRPRAGRNRRGIREQRS